jgi:glutathione S-transferase
MKLFYSPASPFARMARIAARETGCIDQIEEVTVVARPDTPDPVLLAANPLGKIPALAREGQATLFDSRVVCRYLDGLSGAGLYPESKLWEVLTLEALAVGINDAAVGMIYEQRFRPEEMVNQNWLDWQWQKVERALDALATTHLDQLQGDVNAGQTATGAALGYLDFRHSARNWRNGRDELASWYQDFARRSSMQATEPHD